MKEIGDYLKTSRINSGVSLEEAAEDLNLSVIELENIEEGNIRAFKDMFALKDLVKDYGKYLGVETNVIVDEFNDFMFEHTSKISLDDIIEARKMLKEKDNDDKVKEVVSPYTKISKKSLKDRFGLKPLIIIICVVLVFFILLFVLFRLFDKEESVTTELKGNSSSVEVVYEFTY